MATHRSRGRLMKIGTGRHTRSFGDGTATRNLLGSSRGGLYCDSSDDDENGKEFGIDLPYRTFDDGCLDPEVFAAEYSAARPWHSKRWSAEEGRWMKEDEAEYGSNRNRSRREHASSSSYTPSPSLFNPLPHRTVAETIAPPYLNVSVVSSAAPCTDSLLDVIDVRASNRGIFDPATRRLASASMGA